MKRILILLLALVMCLGCFAACNPQGDGEDTTVEDTTAAPEGDESATLTDAVKYLRSIYKDSAKETPADYDVVLTCGPHIMMQNVYKACAEKGVMCYASLESKMACGIGACLGCTCKTSSGEGKSVCKHGPVFEASEVL